VEPDDGLRRPRGHPLFISDRATVADFVSKETTYESLKSQSQLGATNQRREEGVWHLVARYLDIHAGVSRNPSPSKN
jgi:hypothetical protein